MFYENQNIKKNLFSWLPCSKWLFSKLLFISNNYRPTSSSKNSRIDLKKNSREIPSNILHNWRIAKPGNWHWHNILDRLHTLLWFQQFLHAFLVCLYIILWDIITRRDSYNDHHNPGTELLCHHKGSPLVLLFQVAF